MVVDDDPRICEMLTRYFEAQGRSTRSLQNSTKLMPWLQLNHCSAIILDIEMPGIDGLSLLAEIRRDHPDIPVIMYTGAGYNESMLQTALRAGANGYVSKGLPASETYAAVMRAISDAGTSAT
jgi:DNA-binding NtrC family response regulator